MLRKSVSGLLLTMLTLSMLTLAFRIQPVRATGTIYIRSDGLIDPPSSPMQREGDIYSLTADIMSDAYGIIIQRNNMTLDGVGHVVQSVNGSSIGVVLDNIKNVTIKNLEIEAFSIGVSARGQSSNDTISGNRIANNQFRGIGFAGYNEKIIVAGNTITGNGGAVGPENNGQVINCTIIGNDISNNTEGLTYGLEDHAWCNNLIIGNNISHNQGTAISFFQYKSRGSDNTITGNNITDNGAGISLEINCADNIISENNIAGNAGVGISLSDGSMDNRISNNNISSNGAGIYLSSAEWWTFFPCSNNVVVGNNIDANNGYGIFLLGASNNLVSGNRITNNWDGITLDYYPYSEGGYSNNNVLFENRIAENRHCGFQCFNCSNNLLYYNGFIDNTVQAYAENSTNSWDDGYPFGGNYWSDYQGSDMFSGPQQNLSGGDGLGDTPYIVGETNTDMYPLMCQYSAPDIAAVKVAPYSTTVYPPYPVFISATFENRSNKSESVRARVYANTTTVGTKDFIIRPYTNYTFTTIWNTLGFSGEYTISAYAEPLEDETSILNNRLDDGCVNVMGKGYFIIVAGNRQDNDLLSDINYGCNQVYKILRQVGYSADSIYYLNQSECGYQDLDRDGKNDIDNWASSNNLRWVIETWAASRVSPTQPLYLYLFDHGGSDVFCIDNAPDYVYSWQLASWLDNLEGTNGAPIHVIYAACHSGSFIDELSEAGRVVITSSRADELSLVIPGTWEAFSTPFWNQIKSGHSMGASFNYACSPLSFANPFMRFLFWLHGIHQTPLLDDNGDGVGHSGYLPNYGDGYLANSIYIGACEWPYPWIREAIPITRSYWPPQSPTTLWTKVENNTDLLHVRAYMLPPDWMPPNSTDTLLTLGLECYEMTDPDRDGNWTIDIPIANFTNHAPEAAQTANFTFLITAEQDNGDMATPLAVMAQFSKTLDFGTDEVTPFVSIERPLENRIVSNTITANGTAVDDVCLKKIEVYVDYNRCGTIDLPTASSYFYEFNLDTTLFENGNRTVMVRAFDTTDNCYNQTLAVVFENFVHDTAAINIVSDRSVVGRGLVSHLTVTVVNHGSYPENLNLTLFANESRIASQILFLSDGNYTDLVFAWNTSGFAYAYVISANVTPLEGEIDLSDNTFTFGIVKVSCIGDINGDYVTDAKDFVLVKKAIPSMPDFPRWNADADVNNDGVVNIKDYQTVKTYIPSQLP